MKTIAVVEADFRVSPLGTRSRLTDILPSDSGAEHTVLRRTIRRLQQCRRLAAIHVAVHPSDRPRAESVLRGLPAIIETHEAPPPSWSRPAETGGRLASSRKWCLDSWRGGIGPFAAMDEGVNPWLLEALARRERADGVMPVPAAACLIDPTLCDNLLAHFERIQGDLRMAFAPAPPGLAAPVFLTAMLSDLCKAGLPLGWVFAYRPDDPQRDLTVRDCCFHPGGEIERAAGRLIADGDRAVARLARILQDLGDADAGPDASAVVRWLNENRFAEPDPIPRELEIELTTDCPLPNTALRPRGARVGSRGPLDLSVLDRVFAELATLDDSLVVLGGFGEPMRHPCFGEIVRRARAAGVFGIAVRTHALDLDEAAVAALVDAQVDVVSVLLDAHSPETYARVHGRDEYERARSGVARLLDTVRNRGATLPIVVPELIKTRETMADMEAFYDDWIRRTGAAVITGPSRHGGFLPEMAVVDFAPPRRRACERLWTRAMLLADGRLTICDQDVCGEHALGSLRNDTLTSLWNSERMRRLRKEHLQGQYDGMPICTACGDWYRP